MSSTFEGPSASALAARWWVLVLRGAAAFLFGVGALCSPGAHRLVLVLLWGTFALLDGVLDLLLGVPGAGRRDGWFLAEGVAGIVAGIVAFAWPDMALAVLVLVVAAWAIVSGIPALAAGMRLRHQLLGEWLLPASGVFSIAVGLFLLVVRGAGALTLVWLLGGFAMNLGVMLAGLGLRLRQELPAA